MATRDAQSFTLTFLKRLPIYETTQPYELVGFPDVPTADQSNCVFETLRDIRVEDARNCIDLFKLSDQGFCFLKHVSKCLPVISETGIDNSGSAPPWAYIEETANIVKQKLNAEKVICFDWRLRQNRRDAVLDHGLVNNQEKTRNGFIAVSRVLHCDHSINGGEARLVSHLNEIELQSIQRGDYTAVIVNFWRPLRTVHNAPLILCDKRTVRKNDLLEVDKVQPNMVTQDLYLHFSDTQRWFYLSEQTTDEVTMFVGWQADGTSNGIAEYPPHGCSNDPAGSEATARQSIEVRMIVLLPKLRPTSNDQHQFRN